MYHSVIVSIKMKINLQIAKRTTSVLIFEIYFNPLKKKCVTNQFDAFYIYDTWRMGLLDLNDYRPNK